MVEKQRILFREVKNNPSMIKLTCKDPKIDKIPVVRAYLEDVGRRVNAEVEKKMVDFNIFGQTIVHSPLPDIQSIDDLQKELFRQI